MLDDRSWYHGQLNCVRGWR